MARRKSTNTPTVTLDELVPSYGEHKESLDALDKVVKDENKKIKELLGDDTEHKAGGWKVTKSVQKRDKMDEELLCAKLSAFPELYEAGIIKVQEYVDMQALEDAMYKNRLSKKMLEEVNKCVEHKEVVTLRVSRIKESDK